MYIVLESHVGLQKVLMMYLKQFMDSKALDIELGPKALTIEWNDFFYKCLFTIYFFWGGVNTS